jgi:hypothetical protein
MPNKKMQKSYQAKPPRQPDKDRRLKTERRAADNIGLA